MIRTSMTFRLNENDVEHPYGVSQTVPDQSYTLLELLDRHQRGLPIRVSNPLYSDDDLPNIKAMDLVDIQEMREDLAYNTKQLQKKLKQKQLDQQEQLKTDEIQ